MSGQQPAAAPNSAVITSMNQYASNASQGGAGGAPSATTSFGGNFANLSIITDGNFDDNIRMAMNEGAFFKLFGEINIYNILQEVNMWAGKSPGGLGGKIFGEKIGLLASLSKKPSQEAATPTAPTASQSSEIGASASTGMEIG